MVSRTPEELQQLGEMEKVVLGCILINPNCLEESPQISPGSFQSSRNRDVFQSILELRSKEVPIDVVTVAEQLANTGRLQTIGGPAYLQKLMESAPNVANYGYYAGEILEKQRAMEFRKILEQSLEDLLNGANVDEVSDKLKNIDDTPGKEKFEFLSAAGLASSNFSHEWLVNGVLVKGQPCVIAGPKKCLKTNTLIELAFCLATGNRFLGKFIVPNACNVGVMSGESGPATIQETFARIVKSAGWNPEYVEGLHFCFELPALEDQLDLAQLRRLIKDRNLSALILDPAYLCLSLGDSASNLFSVGDKLKPLSKLGQETGCTIILVHHTRKSTGQNEFSEPQLEEIAFAGFQEWARQWILLNRREAYQPDNAGEHKLWFVAGGSAGHSQSWALDITEGSIEDEGGRIWETRLMPSQEARAEKLTEKERKKQERKEAQAQEDVCKTLDELRGISEPVTLTKVRDRVNLPTDRTRLALSSLVDTGQVICEDMKAGNGKISDHYSVGRGTAGTNGKDTGFPLPEDRTGKGPLIGGPFPCPPPVSESGDEEGESVSGDDYFSQGF